MKKIIDHKEIHFGTINIHAPNHILLVSLFER